MQPSDVAAHNPGSAGGRGGQESSESHQRLGHGSAAQYSVAQARAQDQVNLSAINISRINKNFSPISILDNSQQLLSQMGGFMQFKESDPRNSDEASGQTAGRGGGLPQANAQEYTDRESSEIDAAPKSFLAGNPASSGKTPNLSEQIRKVNKIQIKKRFNNDAGKTDSRPQHGAEKAAAKLDIQSALVEKKIKAAEEQENEQSPSHIIYMAQKAAAKKNRSVQTVLRLLLKYISLEPCDPAIHFQIAILYRCFPLVILSGNAATEAQRQESNLEEALLHFEQVIKHQ